jgi:DNA-binding transcriptional regulator YiaG
MKEAVVAIEPGLKLKSNDSGLVDKPSDAAPKRRKSGLVAAERTDIRSFREEFGLTLDEFAKILGSTSRSVSGWERGAPMSPLAERMFLEVKALIERLSAFTDPEHFSDWLRHKDVEFDGFSPIDLIQTGKGEPVWEGEPPGEPAYFYL